MSDANSVVVRKNTVTTILVVKNGGSNLTKTLDALEAQTLKPERLIIISLGESKKVKEELATRSNLNIIVTKAKSSYGDALKIGTNAALHASDMEWFWMLSEDAAPEPEALAMLMREISRTGSATVAGPKLLDMHDPRKIVELGQGLTWAGTRWALDHEELDQQQYDHLEDVMGVGPVGMLVRRDVWEHLEGFDHSLKHFDDGLDFSVRARLAGFRVIVVPQARIHYQKGGLAGPNRSHLQARSAQLHRRATYANPFFLPLLWLSMPLIAVFAVLWALVRGRPATIFAELFAPLNIFFRPGRVLKSRRVLRRAKTVSWGAIKPLRTDRKTVKNIKAIRKEAILEEQGRARKELHFISQGGLALTVSMGLVSIALTWWLLDAKFLNGGSTAPLGSLAEIWRNTMGEQLAEPINWVYAIFGSLTFWNPSYATVLLFLLAIPLASLGAWMWAARITDNTAARFLAGAAWGLAPILLTAINTGRINTVILMVILPWVLVTLANAHLTWSHAATASLLVALALAVAPSILPAAAIVLVFAIASKPKQILKTLFVAAAPVVLFAPLVYRAFLADRLTTVLADPGIPSSYTPATPWQMLLGFPTFGLDGWGETLSGIGVPEGALTLTVGLMLTPLAVLAATGIFVGSARLTSLVALMGAGGLVTALLSPQIRLSVHINELLPLWPGSGLALYWAALVTLAVLGAPILWRAATPVVSVALITLIVVVTPTAIKLATNNVAVEPGVEQLPAVALAKAKIDPATKTVFLTPVSETEMRLEIVTGTSVTLDEKRVSAISAAVAGGARGNASNNTTDNRVTDNNVTAEEKTVSEMIAALSSVTNPEVDTASAGISYLVLRDTAHPSALGLHADFQNAFDSRVELESVGATSKGMLWRVLEVTQVAPQQHEATPLWGLQLGLVLAILLLALPTTEVRRR